MPKRATSFDLAAISLDPRKPVPLHHQLYEALRTAVIERRLAPATRLPSTRDLCAALAVSRTTVVTAFEQLIAEGYIESRVGDGSYVSHILPDTSLAVGLATPPSRSPAPRRDPGFSQRFQAICATPAEIPSDQGELRPFRPGSPDVATFPTQLWARLLARQWRRGPTTLLDYHAHAGYPPLRAAIAAYVGVARGVQCSAEQVFITNGAQDALSLAALVLLNPGDAVWMEDPGYRGARAALLSAGAQLVPVPIDADGLDVADGMRTNAAARLAYVTPSHQYPTGVTMSLTRRLALLDWAQRQAAWIIEDDYDSEFRYRGRPLSALQGLDGGQRVIYVGTFSKVLFPTLRLGYMIVPPALVGGLGMALRTMQHHMPGMDQAVLTEFIVAGHFARHIRRMRLLYAERQRALVAAVRSQLGSWLQLEASDAGLHLLGWLPAQVDDRAVSAAAQRLGVEAPALSSYSLRSLPRGGLVLGYAGLSVAQIEQGIRSLRAACAAM
jgi:GntR family transcriptional regulator/MocR family aminotransferase